MNDFDITFNENVKPILMGAKTAQSYYRKNSVSALAKDLILQYPVLLSADIPYDQEIIIAKALEIQYAAFQIAVLSADTAFGVDPSQNAGVRDLISRYHSNNDTPNVVDYAGNMIYNIGATINLLSESVDADEQIKLKNTKIIDTGHTSEFLESLWEKPLDAIESSTLNDLYNPSNAIVETVTTVADNLEYAIEAKNTLKVTGYRKGGNGNRNNGGRTNPSKMAPLEFNTNPTPSQLAERGYDTLDFSKMNGARSNSSSKTNNSSNLTSNSSSKINSLSNLASNSSSKINTSSSTSSNNSKGNSSSSTNAMDELAGMMMPSSSFDPRKLGDGSRYANDRNITPRGASVSKDWKDVTKEFTKLEPTMIELEFFVRNGDNSGIRRAVIGVSAMPRSIPSDVMRANIIKAMQHDNTGFKFIAWTRGEQKVVKDFVFNVSHIKEDAMAKSKYDKWFAALRKRKRNSKAFKGSRMAINPLTSLVITKNDAALIRQTSGFDLTNETTAIKLMDSLYLLCFMIVDTDTGLVSTLLDGQQYFTETTIQHLEKASKSKDNDLTNLREMLKLLGR